MTSGRGATRRERQSGAKHRQEAAYNPLDKRSLGESVTTALLQRPVGPLPPTAPFDGAGIYAIYYTGDFPVYSALSSANQDGRFDAPIYVGKAVPEGARRGGQGLDVTAGPVLFDRLRRHAETIKAAKNLKPSDFRCRYLVVDDIWIPLGESLLIERFTPVWNRVLDGFGNNDPGANRYRQKRSAWDTVHPGRSWAEKCQPNRKTQEELLAELADWNKRMSTRLESSD